MIRCTTIGVEPSDMCYEICVLAYRCGALRAWEREKGREDGEETMRIAFIVSAIGVAGFVFLAWYFNHWWIALFGLLFMYRYEGRKP